jgi:superfamily II RNA helicase
MRLNDEIKRLEAECREAESDSDSVAFDDSHEKLTKAKDDLDELRRHQREAIDAFGKTRELNAPNSKAHDNVRKRIATALAHLESKGLTIIQQHLVRTIQPDGKGKGYGYFPELDCELPANTAANHQLGRRTSE